jgi:DNA-binding transcriptional MerR regulator
MNPSQPTRFKVGDVARATGLSVRALHHYDELGLLRPSGRTAAGHRYYLPKDLLRLQRIASLKQLGLSLQEVAACLERPDGELLAVLDRHLHALDARIQEQERLRGRIAWLRDRIANDDEVDVSDLLTTIEETTMFEKHFDKEQLEWLQQRRQEVGDDRIREVEQEWPRLIAEVQRHMQAGTDPTAPEMLVLARRWKELVDAFSQGRADIEQGVANVYRHEPQARERTGLDMQIMSYVGKAMAAL